MTATMVFLHGRGQEFKDPAALVLTWQAGQVAGEQEAFGLDRVLSWGAARSTLTWIARHTRVDQAIIADYLRDVAVYLTRARSRVLDLARKAIPPGVPVLLVSHSLGTVVARDLLDDVSLRDRVRLWVTAGSPLGLDAVQKNLLTPGARHPGVPWVSAYDVHDIVALGHPLLPAWGPPLRDIEVDNGDSPHSIERYLGHPEVAGAHRDRGPGGPAGSVVMRARRHREQA